MSPPDTVTVALPDDPTAAGQARTLVRGTLESWGLDDLVDDAQLAVSELVTNALKHGLPPVLLTLLREPATLRIDVSDARPSTTRTELAVASKDTDESGRGRGIVDEVSDRSGVDDCAGSKSVYVAWDVAERSAS